MKKNNFLVIIPAFNEGKNIVDTINEINKKKYDYLVIDDCSYDATNLICKEKKYNHISNKKNLGLSKTMREGFIYAINNGYDYAIQFDGDGQHDINTIPSMLKKIKTHDIVLGNRFKLSKNHDKKKIIIWKLFRKLIKWNCGQEIDDPTCGLRMYNSKFMKFYIKYKRFEVEPSTLAYCVKKMNMTICDVPTIVYDRKEGESKQFKNNYKIFFYILKQIWRLSISNKFWRYHRLTRK